MKKEQLRMQMIAGIITEDQYKAKLSENDNGSGVSLKEGGNIMTAIEWLVEEANLLENNGWIIPLINQAKEMEKQQVIDAFEDGYGSGYRDNGKMGSEYYNETFTK